MKIHIPSHLTDVELEAGFKSLARSERHSTAQLIAHLAELDERRLYLGAGFSSLFAYCTTVGRMSEGEAYNRIDVARAARRFPVVLDLLAEGSLNITTVRLLVPHLTADNHQALFAEASGRSKREVEELVARHAPRPDVPSSVRKLPTPEPPMPVATIPAVFAPPAPIPTPSPRPLVRPLAPDRYEVRFTASASTCEKLQLAKDLLRHAIPTGDTAEIIDRALTLLLEDLARKKFAATKRPRPSRGTKPGSRDIPAKVQRAAYLRDGGRCRFISKGGRRCNTRAFLEFHHQEPYGIGGEPTVDNIQLRCRAHNGYEAELFYGRRGRRLVPEPVLRPREATTDLGRARLARVPDSLSAT